MVRATEKKELENAPIRKDKCDFSNRTYISNMF